MSNIHTLGNSSDRYDSIPNPWNDNKRSNRSRSSNSHSSATQNWGGGQSVSGRTSSNPWGSSHSNSSAERGQINQSDRGGIHTTADFEDSNTDLSNNRAYIQQAAMPTMKLEDSVWSDNLPEGRPPELTDIWCYSCGCGCCVGPCCSPVRKQDWCNVLKMFTFWMAIIELIMFIVSMSIKRDSDTNWSEASQRALLSLGAKYAPKIVHKYHFHRLILPMFLHGGIFHFIFNMYFTFRVQFYREPIWGFIPTALVYVVSCISGNIMSCVLYPRRVSVGASSALLGIYGFFIMEVASKWNSFQTMQKANHVMSIVLFFIIMLIMGFLSETIDHAAHLGGLLAGLCLGLIILFQRKWVRIMGAVFLGLVLIIPFLMLFLVVNVPDDY